MRSLIIYDKENLDSIAGAAVVRHFVPECELKSFGEFDWEDHTTLRPNLNKRTGYMVGCSLPVEDMKRLAEVSELRWIARSPDNAYKFPIKGSRSERLATCELCWHYFSVLPEPHALRLIGDYVTGRENAGKAAAFCYGLRSFEDYEDPTTPVWDCICTDNPAKLVSLTPGTICTYYDFVAGMISDGKLTIGYLETQNRRIAEAGAFEKYISYPHKYSTGRVLHIEQRCVCLNTPIFEESVFDSVYDPEKHDLKVAFALMNNGKWKVKMWGECAETVAASFGGDGGEFECSKLPWEN